MGQSGGRSRRTPACIFSGAISVQVLMSGCGTLINGTKQYIPIYAPVGSRIAVDEEEWYDLQGEYLKRNRNHSVVINNTTYRDPVRVKVESKFDAKMFALNYIGGPLLVSLLAVSNRANNIDVFNGMLAGTLLLYSVPFGLGDLILGGYSFLCPEEISTDAQTKAALKDKPRVASRRVTAEDGDVVRLTLAIMDFDAVNISANDARMASELVRHEFVKGGTFKVIEKKNMEKILAEQAFQQTGCTDQQCAVKVGRIMNAELVAVGTFGRLGDEMYLLLRLVNVETGEIIFSGRTQGKTVEEMNINSAQLRYQIRGKFRLVPSPPK